MMSDQKLHHMRIIFKYFTMCPYLQNSRSYRSLKFLKFLNKK
eukprot:UN19441